MRALLIGLALVVAVRQAPPEPLAGTYRISVCKSEPCRADDPASAEVHGYLVLMDHVVTPDMLRGAAANALRSWSSPPVPNGCSAMTTMGAAPRTYAGSGGFDLAHWLETPTTPREVTATLYRSPDARHQMYATVAADGTLRGTGRSMGAGAGAPPPRWGDDIIVGRRIGPADFAVCAEGASRRAARISAGSRGHAVLDVPPIDATSTDRTVASHQQRFFVFLSGMLLRPPDVFEGRSSSMVPGLRHIRQLGSTPDVWTIGASARMPDAAAYATEAASRVRTLVERGVPASRISVVGVGDSTAIALIAARSVERPIGVAVIGGCAGLAPGQAPAAAHDVLEIVEAGTAPANRCGPRFGPGARVRTVEIPARDVAAHGPIDERPDDWLDDVVRWARRRSQPPTTPPVHASPRLAAVAYALANGFEMPRSGVVVANEVTYGGISDVARPSFDRRTMLPLDDAVRDARAIARLIGPEVTTGWARDLVACPERRCYAATKATVFIIEELANGPGVYMKLYAPDASGTGRGTLYHAVVDTAERDGGWIATEFRTGPTRVMLR